MAALIQRQTTGLGQKIDCSLLASQVFNVVCYDYRILNLFKYFVKLINKQCLS